MWYFTAFQTSVEVAIAIYPGVTWQYCAILIAAFSCGIVNLYEECGVISRPLTGLKTTNLIGLYITLLMLRWLDLVFVYKKYVNMWLSRYYKIIKHTNFPPALSL